MKKLDPARVAALPPSKVLHPEAEQPKIEHPEDVLVEIDAPEWDADPRVAELRAIDLKDGIARLTPGITYNHSGNFSCPIPSHEDKDPSANITKKNSQVWCCYNCPPATWQRGHTYGGDLITYGACALGHDPYTFPEKGSGTFPRLIDELSDIFGITVTRTASLAAPARSVEPSVAGPGLEGGSLERQVAGAENGKTAGQAGNLVSPGSSLGEDKPTVLPFPGPDDPDEDESAYLNLIPPCNWRDLVPSDTFIYQYMEHYEPEKLPLWYGFWSAMALCGLATGRDAYLDMDSKPVYPNLFLAFFGASGFGKSRSLSHLNELIRLALPYDPSDVLSLGVKKLIEPNSDVRLIEMFQAVEKDSKGGIIAEYPIRGYLEFDELASLVGKSNRTGNPMKPVLHSLYDCAPDIATSSRTHGDIKSVFPFCTTIVGTQPRAIRSLFMDSDVDSGFASRWLYIIAHPIPPADRKLFAPYPDMTTLVEPLKKIHEWAKLMPRKMNLGPQALKTLEEFVQDEVWTISPNKHPMFTKIELSVKKMLTNMAINKFETEITNDTVLDMIKLFPHPKQSYLFLEGDLATSERSEFYVHIEGLISRFEARAGRAPTYNEIWSRVNQKYRDARQVRSALEDLTFLGVLNKTERVNQRGKNSLLYGTTKSEPRSRR